MSLNPSCYCCSGNSYRDCCEPLILGTKVAESPEALMRSRYSAFHLNNAEYIFNTYGAIQRQSMQPSEIAQSNKNTSWCGLAVLSAGNLSDCEGFVEFKAYYLEGKQLYLLHERSQFEKQDSQWRYTTGDISPESGPIKVSRNDPCFCQSGKKFKKCCINKIKLS